MGYCIDVKSCEFTMKEKDLGKALKALKELVKKQELAWIDSDVILKAETFSQAMMECSWTIQLNEDEDSENFGDVVNISFDSEKLGDEDTFFSTIAPYVVENSFIEFLGEDGERWRYVFKNGKMEEITPTVSW